MAAGAAESVEATVSVETPAATPIVTGIRKYSEIGNGSAVKTATGIQ